MGKSEKTNQEEQKTKPLIIADGDMSKERLQYLILQGEWENLDYKEMLDLHGSSGRKRTKVDIVCDLVSMANTAGGYILVGVGEDEENGEYPVRGVDGDTIVSLTQAKLQNWADSFVDTTLKIKVSVHDNEEKKLVMIWVDRARVPVVFNKDGQYLEAEKKSDRKGNKSSKTKFRNGELFVRHGSKSERASYEDWIEMVEKIREDERGKVFQIEGRHKDLSSVALTV